MKQAKLNSITIEVMADDCPDVSYLEQEGFEDRLEQYQNGLFGFIGIRAKAKIIVPFDDYGCFQTISSGGLWGIENDSYDEYLASVATEELQELKEQLQILNVDLSNWGELETEAWEEHVHSF